MAVWYCKIGEADRDDLPKGSDAPMRDAVGVRYTRVTGLEPDFLFSGWGAELTESERAVVEDRLPDPALSASRSPRDLEAAEALAQRFHETYERLAPEHGYETRKDSAMPWEQVPEQNRGLMVAVAAELLPLLEPEEEG